MTIVLAMYHHLLTSFMMRRSRVICTFGRHLRRPSSNARSRNEGCLSRHGCTIRHNTDSACILFFSFVCPASFLLSHFWETRWNQNASKVPFATFAVLRIMSVCGLMGNVVPTCLCSALLRPKETTLFGLEVLLFETFINNRKTLLSPW